MPNLIYSIPFSLLLLVYSCLLPSCLLHELYAKSAIFSTLLISSFLLLFLSLYLCFFLGSNDGFLRLWQVQDRLKGLVQVMTIPEVGFVNALAFSSDGTTLVAGMGQVC